MISFDELTLDDRAGRHRGERTIERDDAAECGGLVRAVRAVVGGARMSARDRDTARIRMFDDDARGLGELPHAFERSVAVSDVVIRQHPCLAAASPVPMLAPGGIGRE